MSKATQIIETQLRGSLAFLYIGHCCIRNSSKLKKAIDSLFPELSIEQLRKFNCNTTQRIRVHLNKNNIAMDFEEVRRYVISNFAARLDATLAQLEERRV